MGPLGAAKKAPGSARYVSAMLSGSRFLHWGYTPWVGAATLKRYNFSFAYGLIMEAERLNLLEAALSDLRARASELRRYL